MKKWFKAKSYGWGWTPNSWQAWLIVFLWIIIYTLALINILEQEHIYINFIIILVSVALLLLISWLTGEKPHWSWGRVKNKHDRTTARRNKN